MGDRTVGLIITTIAVLLAVVNVSILFDDFNVVVGLTAGLIGAVFLIVCIFSFVEICQRTYQLLRYVSADVREGHDLASLASGQQWLRVEATVHAQDDPITGVVDDSSLVAITVKGESRERFPGVSWFSTQSGARFEYTDAVPAALDRATTDVTIPAGTQQDDDEILVLGAETTTVTVGDEVSAHTRQALSEFGIDVEHTVFKKAIFEHYVRIVESTVGDGATIQLFGPFTVENDGTGTTLTPAGRSSTRPLLTTAGWKPIRWHAYRQLGLSVVLAPLTGGLGLAILWGVVQTYLW